MYNCFFGKKGSTAFVVISQNQKMTQFILKISVVLVSFFLGLQVCAATGSAPVVVGYFSPEPQSTFEAKVKPLFAKQTQNCSKCQILNLTPYDDKGQFQAKSLEESIKSVPAEVKILFFDFNLKKTEVPPSVIELLSKQAANGILVVASAGVPHEQQASSPLSRTLFGQIKEAFIIGELGDRDRLMQQSFYGPEMLTALRPPKDMQGQNLGPLIFASRLATDYNRRTPQEWTGYIRDKKMRSRKIWPELQDFFN